MVYGFGIFMALVVGLHGPVAHHVGALWARAMVAMRKYFFDTEELVPSDGAAALGKPYVQERSPLIPSPPPPNLSLSLSLACLYAADQSLEDNPRVRELLYELRASGLLRTRRYGVRRFKHCLVGAFVVTWRRCVAARADALTSTSGPLSLAAVQATSWSRGWWPPSERRHGRTPSPWAPACYSRATCST